MTSRYVALDTETTGLDPEHHEVIEVAAIAFDADGNILGEYNTLVRPRHQVPYHIERLTGIAAAEVEAAPLFSTIAQELAEFIGDSPIIGQSVEFDLKFLAQGGVWPSGPIYDTFDLAQLLLPGLPSYALREIADALQIDFPVRHRALADSEASRAVFLEFRRRLCQMPGWLLAELERLATAGEWSLAGLFRETMREAAGGGFDLTAGLTSELLAKPDEIAKALNGGRDATAGDGEVLSLLRRAGSVEGFFQEFEARPEQETMAAAVNAALSEQRHLVVEAGTGTGKSLAYLLPAALQALRRSERVVVSTDTIGLQEQLILKDLPVVQQLLAQVETEPLRVASLKGRRNYLCLQRWTAARHAAPASKQEAQLMARLLVWLRHTQTGDRADLNLRPDFDQAWSRMSSENTPCIQTQCPFVRNGTCFMLRARKRAEAAHVLVVNHALLLSDLATGGHVLPPYTRLIIDEAHNLEDEATSRFAFRAGENTLNDWLDRVGRRTGERTTGGIASSLTDAARGESILGPGAYVASLSTALASAAMKARSRLQVPFKLITRVLKECAEEGETDRMLVTRATRVQPLWSDVQIAAESLGEGLNEVIGLLESLREVLEGPDLGLIDQGALAAEAADLTQQGIDLQRGLYAALLEEDPSLICWLERGRGNPEVSVCTAPLAVDEILRRELFETKESVILTSATLSTEGQFGFLRERLGLDDAEELHLGSPFDFERSTLIALPTDLPDPNEPDFVDSVSELLVEAVRASQGRALVLFTSYGLLNAVYAEIKAPLEAEGILVLAHGTDGSPRQLLNSLRENTRTVILGTASFWEGVDVQGEALSLLTIVRLPFAVPTDPIYQARSALYDEPFDQYALPQAVLRFRQGFGRLIRSKTDRGVLIVLDRRLRGKRYGDVFLRSLPRCTVQALASREVAGAVEAWLLPQHV